MAQSILNPSRVRLVALFSLFPLLSGCLVIQDRFPPRPGLLWRLAWSDEFSAPDGSAPDPKKWTYDIGGKGWGNQELESYTNRKENVRIEKGNLVITAQKTTYTGADGVTRDYTSARLKTQGLFTQTYGRVEARIKIPAGQGMWPAFWMLGDDISSVGWPKCGEIDIMENIGKEPATVHGSLHGPSTERPTSDLTSTFGLPTGQNFGDDFHLYAVEWDPEIVRFYVDSNLFAMARGRQMGFRPSIFYDSQSSCRRRLARQPRRVHQISSKHAR